MISCEWSVPPVLADRLRQAGRLVPPPILGQLVIDTGAGRTSITQPVAQQLGLTPLRIQTTYGAGGRHELPVYRVRLTLQLLGAKAAQIFYDTEATGVEDIHEAIAALNLMHYGQPVRLVGLLGRDLLQHATLTYRGTSGRFEVAFDPKSFNQPPSRQTAPVTPPQSPSGKP
jgi:hypothetical protein